MDGVKSPHMKAKEPFAIQTLARSTAYKLKLNSFFPLTLIKSATTMSYLIIELWLLGMLQHFEDLESNPNKRASFVHQRL